MNQNYAVRAVLLCLSVFILSSYTAHTQVIAGIRANGRVMLHGDTINGQARKRIAYYYANQADIDADGDLDIFAFDFSGNTVEYHQNFSVERGGKQPFVFRKVNTCWGGFTKVKCERKAA